MEKCKEIQFCFMTTLFLRIEKTAEYVILNESGLLCHIFSESGRLPIFGG